ncbi:MAG: efflux transporter outer membrane subunit [Bacillota bacterium]
MRRAVVLLALVAAGCMVGPNYKRPAIDLPGAYNDPEAKAGNIAVPPQWWTVYNDPVLNDLVASGLAHNADVLQAIARVEEAEGALREAWATLLFPLVQGNAGASRSRAVVNGDHVVFNSFSLGASTSFEVDVWGRLRRAERLTRDRLASSRYGRDTVALTLAATIARTYFAVRSLDSQVAASEEIATAAKESLDLATKRANAGVASDLDVYQAGSLYSLAAAQAKETARQRAVSLHELGVLTGRLDLTLPWQSVESLPVPPTPPSGLPSQLLERRPDVREAEETLAAATENIGIQRAAQFPTLSLTGSFGVQSGALSSLFDPASRIWSVGAGLLGPIIDGGRYAARTQQAEAQARQAEAAYLKVAQNAFREVADALTSIRLAADQETDLRTRVDQARGALRLAALRYERGYSAYLEVLDAQRTLNDAELAYIRNRQAYLSFTVDLMNALGGGWAPST